MDKSAWIYVAANNSEQAKKDNADFVCTGAHDELTIQKAIDKCADDNKNLFLYNGKYFIEGFYDFGDGGPKTALLFPNLQREIKVYGETSLYSRNDGVRLFVAKKRRLTRYLTPLSTLTQRHGKKSRGRYALRLVGIRLG